MTEKETVTAREDQRQLGTCKRDYERAHIAPHEWVPEGPGHCIDWRPEDQPRPTPPDCQKDSNLITAPGKDFTGEMTIAEAQGEAPQDQGCSESGDVWHVHGKDGHCVIRNKPCPRACILKRMASLERSIDGLNSYIKIEQARVARVETGAHPSQDAQEPSWARFARHLPTCGRGSSVADSLAGMAWQFTRHKWRDCDCGLADLCMRARSTPSPDPPLKGEKMREDENS